MKTVQVQNYQLENSFRKASFYMIRIKHSTNTHLHYKMCAKGMVCVPAYLQTHLQEETFHFHQRKEAVPFTMGPGQF